MSHGRYSRVTRNALEPTVTHYVHHNGSPSERTRSRIRAHLNPIPHATNLGLTTPSAGNFAHSRLTTRITQRRAEYRLRNSRIRLRRYLTSDRWQPEFEDLNLRAPTRWRVEQLGTINGDIDSLLRPPAATWDSDVRIHSRRARRRARSSGLSDVHYNYAESVLDSEFGVLPGEMWGGDDEEDWEAAGDIVSGLTEDGRMLEAMMDGKRMEGVWRDVVGRNLRDDAIDMVARLALARE